jgi:diguanylate cyclase (GGDEF)-like protein
VFSRSWLDELVISLQEKVGQLAGVLSLELPPGTDYRDVLARSREQMSHVASEVVGDLLRERYSRHSSTCDDLNDELRLSVEAKALQAAVEAAACGMDAGLGRSLSAGTVCGDLRSAALAGPGMPLEIAAHTLETDSLVGRLRAHVLTSRQHRTPLSLLLIEVDHYTQVIFNCGATGAQQLFDQFQRLCEMLDVEGVVCVPLHEAGFAVILPDCDRAHAVRVGNQLVREARELRLGPANSHRSTMTVSVGAATVTLPPRNFQAEELVQRADRCLYGARASGGDVLKSIEIYGGPAGGPRRTNAGSCAVAVSIARANCSQLGAGTSPILLARIRRRTFAIVQIAVHWADDCGSACRANVAAADRLFGQQAPRVGDDGKLRRKRTAGANARSRRECAARGPAAARSAASQNPDRAADWRGYGTGGEFRLFAVARPGGVTIAWI